MIDRLPTWSTRVHETAGQSRILVAVTDGRRHADGRTFVAVQGFQSWIEAFEMQRFALIARELSARLVVVEVPGFGVAGSQLLPSERKALLRGNFGPLAARMLNAAEPTLDEQEPLSFLGYSMGASIATAMATSAEGRGRSLDQLILVEPVALHRWGIRELLATTRREDRWIDDYVAANDTIDWAVAPWDRRPGVAPATRRRRDLLLLGSALRHGALAHELASPAVRPQRVVVVRGDRSALSEAAYVPLLAALRQREIATAELVVPGHHAFWHSLAAVEDMARQLRELI